MVGGLCMVEVKDVDSGKSTAGDRWRAGDGGDDVADACDEETEDIERFKDIDCK